MKRTNLDSKLSQISGLIDYSIYALNIHRHSSFIKHALEGASKLLGDLITPEKSRKAQRNISDDKRRNLKRKFRIERDYVREPWDELKSRDDAIYCESSDDYRATLKEVKASWGVEKITFKPRPLPG